MIRVRECMDPNPSSILPRDTLKQAVEIMLSKEHDGIVVVDENMRPLGVITLAYLLRGFVPEHVERLSEALIGELEEVNARAFFGATSGLFLVADFFRTEINAVALDDSLPLAAAEMERQRLDFLPVVDKSRLAGVIRRRDIMRVFFDIPKDSV
ncbi:CBS domain-containing protein [bacterium]|nr:CBS domain-containing protein [bacterium]